MRSERRISAEAGNLNPSPTQFTNRDTTKIQMTRFSPRTTNLKPKTNDGIGTWLSPDGKYRFTLTRQVGCSKRTVTFCMLNPSYADAERNDRTISKCMGFAERWGFGRLIVVNLSPFRATKPRDLFAEGEEPPQIWATNISAIAHVLDHSEIVVMAYGNHGARLRRGMRVISELQRTCPNSEMFCLGTTKYGHPKHPRPLPYATELVAFRP